MKKACLLMILGVFALQLNAQTKTPVKPKTTPKPAAPVLKTQLDSFSYAVGMSIALQYKEFGVKKLNTAVVMKAVNDVLANGKLPFSADQANYVLNDYINMLMEKQAAENIKAGQAWLAANKNKAGVFALPSGLQYLILKEGSGPKPSLTDSITVHYHGTLTNGTVFESSVESGMPVKLRVDGVIPGWTEALLMMPVGSRWRLFIPSDLAYGNFSPPGSPIPPGSTLVFDVELLAIKGK
jgi:FKBP-type peptidyl-prolyl cis-trans isomerase FklB